MYINVNGINRKFQEVSRKPFDDEMVKILDDVFSSDFAIGEIAVAKKDVDGSVFVEKGGHPHYIELGEYITLEETNVFKIDD